MKRLHHAALLLFSICSIPAAHAAAADGYAYAWPVQTQDASSAWQVELTPEVYAATASADLRDVEVVNGAGDPVPMAPYRALVATPAAREALLDLPTFSLPAATTGPAPNRDEAIRLQIERGPDGKLRRVDANVGAAAPAAATDHVRQDLLIDASGVREPLAALRIDWPAGGGDATAQFEVDASEDLQRWRTLVPRATVLRLTQAGNVLDRHDIALETMRASYLRVHRLDDGAELPGMTARVRTLSPSSAAQPSRQWIAAAVDGSDSKRADASMPPSDGQRPIAWRYHLPAPLAIDSVRLELVDDNSLARVHVLSRQRAGEDAGAWLQRGGIVAFRLHQGDSVIGNDEFSVLPSARVRDWRIESATPLDHAPALSVAYQPDRFVFLAQGQGPYRLVAGSAKSRRGDYPVDAALASLRATQGHDWQPPLATLGTRVTLAGESALTVVVPEKTFDWKTWLLWAVLVGAAALIGGLALSLLRSKS